MRFNEPITTIIPKRRSWRSFEDRPIPKETLSELTSYLSAPSVGPFGSRVRLELLLATDVGDGGPRKLGTYGVIKNAPFFMAGIVERGDRAMEDFGYVFEHTILKATELGLQTCWLGGTFSRENFGNRLATSDQEIIPAVTPVGYARRRRSLVDRTFRTFAGSKKRKPWRELFFDSSFANPLSQNKVGFRAQLLEMVRLAPSASNKQPWRIVLDRDGQTFHLYLSRTAGYGRLLSVDLQRIDMGIAMCHLALSARELGIQGEWLERPPEIGRLPERTTYVASFVIPES